MIGQKRKKDWLTWIGDLSPIFLKELQKPRQPLWAKKQSNSLTMNLTIYLRKRNESFFRAIFRKIHQTIYKTFLKHTESTWRVIRSCPENGRSEEHTSELQSRGHLVCRLLLEKKKKKKNQCD